jgi:hypothetical protein
MTPHPPGGMVDAVFLTVVTRSSDRAGPDDRAEPKGEAG